jgi:F420H(2)-dependent quinone reductase
MSFPAAFIRTFLRFHQTMYVQSGGLIGHRMVLVPTLLLRTVGRRSGRERVAALVYARDGHDYVVVASNDGADDPPAWLHNLNADPHVGLQVGRHRSGGVARVVERGDADYDRLWRLVNERNHGRYDGYQARTRRPIALVAVTPTIAE